MQSSPVKLHVYDLSGGLAASMSRSLIGKQIDGIWHTGIVAFDTEWYWSGILQQGAPGQTPYGIPARVIPLGDTHMNREIFEDFIAEISAQYNYDTYDLLRNNCNNFSERASLFLTGNSIPDWIANLPNEVLATPFGRMIEPMIGQWTNRMKQQHAATHGYDPSNFPALQASLNQQVFRAPQSQAQPHPQAAHSSIQPSVQPTPTATSAPAAAEKPESSSATNASSAHLQFKPLFADQRPSSFETVLKQLTIPERNEQVVQGLRQYFDEKNASLAPEVLSDLLQYAYTCDLAAGFAPLFILRLLVLNEQINTAFSSDERGIQILHRFIHTESSPVSAKAMALVLSANLFSHKAGQTLLLDSPHTTEWLGAELLASTDQRRTPAAGLLYNYALALSKLSSAAIDQHEDKFWQTVTLLAEVLSESAANPAPLKDSEQEYYWRLCSSLFFLVQSDESAKDVAKQLELAEPLKTIHGKTSPSHTRLSPVLKDLLKLL